MARRCREVFTWAPQKLAATEEAAFLCYWLLLPSNTINRCSVTGLARQLTRFLLLRKNGAPPSTDELATDASSSTENRTPDDRIGNRGVFR